MANTRMFSSSRGKIVPRATSKNEAGGRAYDLEPKQALARIAATGCFNDTFYVSGEAQLDSVLELCEKVDPVFIAKTAVYARDRGYMKDMPAFLLAVLSVADSDLFAKVFPRVIDSPKMLRTFVQIMRSGAAGRKSLGTRPKKLIQQWIASKTPAQLFRGSVGQSPSLADVLKMVHPKPKDEEAKSLYGYLVHGRANGANAKMPDGMPWYNAELLPKIVRDFETYKQTKDGAPPDVPFQMLTALNLGTKEWTEIARNASWQMTRMNLNTFARHGVFEDKEVAALVAARLRNPELIAKAKVFPYQLMVAYTMVGSNVPHDVREALQDAMEIAIANVPAFGGKVYVFPDVSGSMRSAVTGYRPGATSAVSCQAVAALVASAVLRQNRDAEVIPFSDRTYPTFALNPRDSVMTNAEKISNLEAGGTNCALPLRLLNERGAMGDLCIFVSDNESWITDSSYRSGGGNLGTEVMREWRSFQARNHKAKLVCIDLTPNTTTQAKSDPDILNCAGFSDSLFSIVKDFASGDLQSDRFVATVEAIEL